jgi:hypothetical protein
LNALWILNELDTLKKVLEPRESLLDRFRTQQKERRRRASKRKTLIDARS